VLVVASSPGVALLIDAGSYGASALLLTRVTSDVRATAPRRFLIELRDGFAEFRARTWVWATIAALSVANAAGVAFAVLGPVVAKHELSGAGAWALILAVEGIGSLLAGTTLLRFRPRRPLLVAVLVGLLPAAPMFLLAIPAPLAVIAVAALGYGVGGMVFNTLWETTLQQYIPADARSRLADKRQPRYPCAPRFLTLLSHPGPGPLSLLPLALADAIAQGSLGPGDNRY
jgi:hypothetical protein